MRGPHDELRCPKCAGRYSQIYEQVRHPEQTPKQPLATAALCIAAGAASLAYWSAPAETQWLVSGPWVWDGQVWRLFTDALPHVNYLHLLFNLYWIWRFGQRIEGWLGSLRYAGLVVLLAVGSSAASFLCSENGIGLSGVAFGLFGLLFALRNDKDFAAQEMQPNVIQLWVVWFFLCIGLTYTKVMPIGNVAHGAGMILGWLVGRAVLARQRAWLLSGITVLVVSLVLGTQYMPWDGLYAWHLGAKLADRGAYAEALPWYEQAARAHPDNQELRDYVRHLREFIKVENTAKDP
jgi:membrane associated rhomboid family serine protease